MLDPRSLREIVSRSPVVATGGLLGAASATTPHYLGGLAAEAAAGFPAARDPARERGGPEFFQAAGPLPFNPIGAVDEILATFEGADQQVDRLPFGPEARALMQGAQQHATDVGVPMPLQFAAEMAAPDVTGKVGALAGLAGKLFGPAGALSAAAGKLSGLGAIELIEMMAPLAGFTAARKPWSINPKTGRLGTDSQYIADRNYGEGGTLYTSGHYMGEHEGTADWYQQNFARDQITRGEELETVYFTPDGDKIDVESLTPLEQDALEYSQMSEMEARRMFDIRRNVFQPTPLSDEEARMMDLADRYRSEGYRVSERRAPRPPVYGQQFDVFEDELIDLDKPVSDQPRFEAVARELLDELDLEDYEYMILDESPLDVYNFIAKRYGSAPYTDVAGNEVPRATQAAKRAVADAFAERGILGAQYFDELSRGDSIKFSIGPDIIEPGWEWGGAHNAPMDAVDQLDAEEAALSALQNAASRRGATELDDAFWEEVRSDLLRRSRGGDPDADPALDLVDQWREDGMQMSNRTRNYVSYRDEHNYIDPDRTDPSLIGDQPIGKPWRTTPIRQAKDFAGADTIGMAMDDAETVTARETDPDVIEWLQSQGKDIEASDVLEAPASEIANSDHYHASPVCKNLSCAKAGRNVDALDEASAQKVADNIGEALPPAVTVENVPAYRDTVLMDDITNTLDAEGYLWDVVERDAAPYGGASSRKRIILRAVREGELPPLPEKTGPTDWFETIEDLIDDAPDSEFVSNTEESNREIQAIQDRIQRFEDSGGKHGLDPSKPIISPGVGKWGARNAGGAAPTGTSTHQVARILMPDGRIKQLTPRMMARLMGIADDVPIPDDYYLAKKVLGNGIHGEVTRQIIQPVAEAGRRMRTKP